MAPQRTSANEGRSLSGQAAGSAAQPWVVIGVILIAAFMELLDVTILNVAIPSIRTSLHASYGELQWMIAGYQLAFAVGLMTGGRLGDIYGRKLIFLIGVTGFTAASVFASSAVNPEMLITARVIQGLASATMLPQVLSTIHVTFPAEKRQAAFAVFGSVVGMASVAGPVVGGLVINANLFSLGWRPIFLINVPLGLVAIVGAVFVIKESKSADRPRLDLPGAALSGVAAFVLIFPLIQGRDANWAAWTWVMLCASVPLLVIFALAQRRRARRGRAPLLDLSLFRQRGFVVGLLITLVFFGGVASFSLIFMLTLQVGQGYSALHAGLTVFPMAMAAGFGSGMSAAAVKVIGRTVLQFGTALCVGGMVWLSVVVSHHAASMPLWDVLGPLVVAGVGLGLVIAPLSDIVLAGTRLTSTGSASGMLSTMIQFGGAIGVALLGTIFFGLLGSSANSVTADIAPQIRSELVATGVPTTTAGQIASGFRVCFSDRAQEKDSQVTPPSCRRLDQGTSQAMAPILARQGATALARDFSEAMSNALYYEVAIFGLAFLLVFFLPKVTKTDLDWVAVTDQ